MFPDFVVFVVFDVVSSPLAKRLAGKIGHL